MPKYQTNQRKVLLDYLEQRHDELLTAAEIAQDLQPQGVSLSAIYRNLAALEEEGKLKRHAQSGDRTVRYQYLDSHHCRGAIHLFCKVCGKSEHLEEKQAEELTKEVSEANAFTLDPAETVLYGICKNCKQK